VSLVGFDTLRAANTARQAEWDTGGNIDLSYAGNELAGEVSEAIAEAVIDGGPDISDLSNELADVVICCDLIAMRVGFDPELSADPVDLEDKTAQRWVNELGADLQLVCNTIKKLERERHGMPGSRATLADLEVGLWNVGFSAYAIADCYGIDLDAAVARKFNATSEKVGLKTRYLIL
jgi:NTP pyrophosphatase (non-canonical NTP hydrolase)